VGELRTATANDKVYIHEFITITKQNRARYMHHMTANWSPIAQEQRNQLCYGVWGTIGSTGTWPGRQLRPRDRRCRDAGPRTGQVVGVGG